MTMGNTMYFAYGNVFDMEKVFEREIQAEKNGGALNGKRRRHEQSR